MLRRQQRRNPYLWPDSVPVILPPEESLPLQGYGDGKDRMSTGHESDTDPDMQMIKFVRAGQTTLDGKEAKDIILVNFQGHPHMGASAGYYNAHSDAIGVPRDELEAELDCQAIYFSGAGGNMDMTSRIEEENITGKDYKRYGKALAKYVLEAEDSYKEASLSMVTAKKEIFVGQNDHSEDHRVEEAQEAYDLWLNKGFFD